ncbi:hypothetical protein ACRAWF_00280 [Streptomyces sp. L7]
MTTVQQARPGRRHHRRRRSRHDHRRGADWIRFALRLPSGKDDIPEQDAAAIIKGLQAPHAGVLIGYLTDAEEISAFCHELGVVAVQLHGDVETRELRRLKELRPELFVLKSRGRQGGQRGGAAAAR